MSCRDFKRPANRSGAANSRKGGNHRAKSAPITNGQRQELKITGFSHDGRGISRVDGKTFFVDGALPGEQVLAVTVQEHSRFTEARSFDVLVASDQRGEPNCSHYHLCGGCNLQHLRPSEQLALKEAAVLDQFQRWSGLTPKRVLPALTSNANGYRTRARLAVWYFDDGRVELGFRRAHSQQLVDINTCTVLDGRLNSLLSPLRAWLKGLSAHQAVTHIELIATDTELGVVLRHTRALEAIDLAALSKLAVDNPCVIWLKPSSDSQLFDLDGKACDPRMHYLLPDQQLDIQFHPTDFTQVNADMNRAMVAQALDLLGLRSDERVLDLFCGVGNFTLAMARQALDVIGVEGTEAMVERGRENATANGLDNCQYFTANLEADVSRLAWAKKPVDAVLLDPPRAGAKGAMNWLKQLSASRVVYVSCNPATLARDAKSLAGMGYRLEALGVMDMFPETAHIESMALFVKN